VLGSFVLSSARITEGRQGFAGSADASVRMSTLIAGTGNLLSTETRQGLLDDYVYRVDANFFGALVLDAIVKDDVPPVGAATLTDSVMLAIPQFLNPGKLDSAVESRSEKAFYVTRFGLPTHEDLLPGMLGPMVGYAGRYVFFALSFLLGAGMGALDRFLRTNTPVRTVLALGVVNCIMYYERGLGGVAVTIRGILTIMLLMQVLRFAERAARGGVHRPLRGQFTWPAVPRPLSAPTILRREQ